MTHKEFLEIKLGELSKEILLNETALLDVRKTLETLDKDVLEHEIVKERMEEIKTIVGNLIEMIDKDKQEFKRISQELERLNDHE